MDLSELRKIERKWQEKWETEELFNANPKNDKEKFFITVPYPYTNAPLHVGHGRAYTIGDVIARYKRMKGYNVLFPMAFHISGTPISSISDQIQRGYKEKIEMYRSYIGRYVDDPDKVEEILDSFKHPFNVAEFFAKKIIEDFKRVGFSIDWRRKFHTGMDMYNHFVSWQFRKLKEKGALKKGRYHVRYCLRHEQAAGEDDIEDGDVNPVDIKEFVAIKFKFNEGYLLASTLRPETLFGATNLWADPEASYVKVRWNNQLLYMSKNALVKFKHQHNDVKKVKTMEGAHFIGENATSPFGDELLILPASFVDPDNASGFVYSEPSDAPYDYVGLKALKKHSDILREYEIDQRAVATIEPIKIITYPGVRGHHTEKIVKEMNIQGLHDPKLEEATKKLYEKQFYNGKMNEKAGEYAGMPVQKAREEVKKQLLGKREALIFYETSRKAVCRAGGKIIVARVEDQWFLDYSLEWWKEKVRKWLDEMVIRPRKYTKAFYDTVDWLRERPCARKRGLGTKLPFDTDWVIESLSDSTIYMAFYTVVHLINEHDVSPNQLTPSFFSYVFLGSGNVREVGDETGVSKNLLKRMREEFLYWYPVDLRHTGVAHLSNHLTFFIFHHLAIFDREHAPRGISINEMLIREGRKMSKSKGNVILLRDIAENYSADLFRLVSTSTAELDSTLNWTSEKVTSARRKLLSFADLSFNAIESDPPADLGEPLPDRWFLSKFYSTLQKGDALLEQEKLRTYVVEVFFQLMSDLSYYRKRRNTSNSLAMLRKVLPDWIRMLAPIIPHLAEEIWMKLGREGFISLETWPENKEKFIDKRAEFLEERVKNALADTREIMHIVEKDISKAIFIIAADWKRTAFSVIREVFEKEGHLEVGSTMQKLMTHPELKDKGRVTSKIVQRVAKEPSLIPDEQISQKQEKGIFEHAKEFLQSETGLEVQVISEEVAIEKGYKRKARGALPLKPGILLK